MHRGSYKECFIRRLWKETPQDKKEAGVSYQTTVTEYDDAGNMTAKEEQTDSSGMISEYLINGQKSKETADTIDKDGKKSSKTAAYTYDSKIAYVQIQHTRL